MPDTTPDGACEHGPAEHSSVTMHLPWKVAILVELVRDGVVEHRVSSLHDDGCVDVFVSGTPEAIAAVAADVVALRAGS